MKPLQSRRQFVHMASCALAFSTRATVRALGTDALPQAEEYQPTWESLRRHRVPSWYEDAKFGIFIHWGVYSVPAFDNEWYPRNMYLKGSPVYEYHRQHFGPQSTFGYKDFIPRLTAANWNPDRWVELFQHAGAKYVVPVGEHHDGFPMYDCSHTDWNAAKRGPRRDVVGELATALRRRGLRLGVSSHRAFNWSYYTFNEDFDTVKPENSGLYGIPHAPTPRCFSGKDELRQKPSREFVDDWYSRTVEIVDKYHPDLMWFDFCFECPEFEEHRKRFAAYYYNHAAQHNQEVVINYKHAAYPEGVAVLDIERGLLDSIRPHFWQTDTSISWKSWGYIDDDSYKSAGAIVHELVDIVSKNGCLLLNVGPRPDGTITVEGERVLNGIGDWLRVNGEAIYGTRPWEIYGEGPNKLAAGQFGETEKQQFTAQDIRFTAKKNTIYAVLMDWPGNEAIVKSLGRSSKLTSARVDEVGLLGSDQRLEFRHSDEALAVKMPSQMPCQHAFTLRITMRT